MSDLSDDEFEIWRHGKCQRYLGAPSGQDIWRDSWEKAWEYANKTIDKVGEANVEFQEEVRLLKLELKNIKSTCPNCGTTEMLCGHNGPGCTSSNN